MMHGIFWGCTVLFTVLILAVLLSGRKWLDHPERGEELG